MNKLFEYLATTELTDSPESIIFIVLLILFMTGLCIFMFWGLRKCFKFGKATGHNVISGNIILMAVPMFLIFFISVIPQLQSIPLYVIIIVCVICWGISIVSNFIFCRIKIRYAFAYTFFQFLFALLGTAFAFSIIGILIFVGVIGICTATQKSEYYNLTLIPVSQGITASMDMIIRARHNDDDPQILDGENGEIFSSMGNGEYMLISTPNTSNSFEIYRIY